MSLMDDFLNDDESVIWAALCATISSSVVGSVACAKILGPLGAGIGIFLGPIVLWYGLLFGVISLTAAQEWLDKQRDS